MIRMTDIGSVVPQVQENTALWIFEHDQRKGPIQLGRRARHLPAYIIMRRETAQLHVVVGNGQDIG